MPAAVVISLGLAFTGCATAPEKIVPQLRVNEITNEWIHMVGVFDNGNVHYYVNGELIQSATGSGSLKLPAAGSRFLCIGGDSGANGTTGAYFAGKIAIVNMYSEALVEAQIQSIYETLNPNIAG